MQREAGVWAGKPVGSELSTTFTPMSDKPPWGLRPRRLVLSDRADEIKAAIQRYQTLGLLCPDDWLIELRDIERQQAILDQPQPEPAPEPTPAAPGPELDQSGNHGEDYTTCQNCYVVYDSSKPWCPNCGYGFVPELQPEIPEPLRTGAASFFVLMLSQPYGGVVQAHSTLHEALELQARLGSRLGTTHIAECRIIPELTREVPSNDS